MTILTHSHSAMVDFKGKTVWCSPIQWGVTSELKIWRDSVLKRTLELVSDAQFGLTPHGDRKLAVFGDPGYVHALGVLAPIQNASTVDHHFHNKCLSHFRIHVERSYGRIKAFAGLDRWSLSYETHQLAFHSLLPMHNIDLELRPLFRPLFITDEDGPRMWNLFQQP